jgi:hypothetical protein
VAILIADHRGSVDEASQELAATDADPSVERCGSFDQDQDTALIGARAHDHGFRRVLEHLEARRGLRGDIGGSKDGVPPEEGHRFFIAHASQLEHTSGQPFGHVPRAPRSH